DARQAVVVATDRQRPDVQVLHLLGGVGDAVGGPHTLGAARHDFFYLHGWPPRAGSSVDTRDTPHAGGRVPSGPAQPVEQVSQDGFLVLDVFTVVRRLGTGDLNGFVVDRLFEKA